MRFSLLSFLIFTSVYGQAPDDKLKQLDEIIARWCSVATANRDFVLNDCIGIGIRLVNSSYKEFKDAGLNLLSRGCKLGNYATCAVFAYSSDKGTSVRDDEAFELVNYGCHMKNRTSCEALDYLNYKYNGIGEIEDFL